MRKWPATVANIATLRAAFAEFKKATPYGSTRLRHDQACCAAEMFLTEWESLAVEFQWTADDIFAPLRGIHRGRGTQSGLAYWLDVEIVTALGPEHAITETNRVFDRVTRQPWVTIHMQARKGCIGIDKRPHALPPSLRSAVPNSLGWQLPHAQDPRGPR